MYIDEMKKQDLQKDAGFFINIIKVNMKIMKFGGTSVGTPERMKALIPLITDNERKIVVLSAMSGTTNSLVEITDLLYADNINEASVKIDELRAKYHKVVDDLYETDNFKKTGHELIDSHFEYIKNFTLRVFTKLQEKAILAQGELISTSLIPSAAQGKKYKINSASCSKFHEN